MTGAIINSTTAVNAVTTSVTHAFVTAASGMRIQKTTYKVQHSFQLEQPKTENVTRERVISRGPSGFSLVLVTNVAARGKVRYVTETLTRLGRATTPENFAELLQRLRAQKIMLTHRARPRALGVAGPRERVAPAQAAPRRDGPVLHSHSTASPPSAVANTDADGDVEMTDANAREVAPLGDETMRRVKVTLAELARSTGLQFSGPCRLVQSAGQAPPAIGIELPGTAAAALPGTVQQIRLAVHRVAPGVRVIAFRRAGTVQNAEEQPPPYSAADEARLNAARARAIARRE